MIEELIIRCNNFCHTTSIIFHQQKQLRSSTNKNSKIFHQQKQQDFPPTKTAKFSKRMKQANYIDAYAFSFILFHLFLFLLL